MRALLAFPCADACSATRPSGGIGAATHAYGLALRELGFEVHVIGSDRAIVDDFECLRVKLVGDIVPHLIELAQYYELVVTIGLHSRLDVHSARELANVSNALIYECEDEPSMAQKQYNVLESCSNVRFVSDREIATMPKAVPAVSVPCYHVAEPFVKVHDNRFAYAGRLAHDKNIVGLVASGFKVDYYGVCKAADIQLAIKGASAGGYVPKDLYPSICDLYPAMISFSYERGISYQLVEALRCGMPLVLARSNPAWPSLLGKVNGVISYGRHQTTLMGVIVDTDNIQPGDEEDIFNYCLSISRYTIRRIADTKWGDGVLTSVFAKLIDELGVSSK